jgi:hypothetical protein
MAKWFSKIISVLVLLMMVGCNPSKPKQAAELNDTTNFNFIFKYGVGGKMVLNTFDNTFTWDMVVDPPIVINLSLSKKELNEIQEKIIDIGFFDYPDTFRIIIPPNGSGCYEEPYSSYYFKVKCDSVIKELWWEAEIVEPKDKKVENLMELIELIVNIIVSKEEYKKLPTPRALYQ